MLTIGIDVGASFHVAAFLPATTDAANWKKLETLQFDISRQGFESLKSAVCRHIHPQIHTDIDNIRGPQSHFGHYHPGGLEGQGGGHFFGHCVKVAMEPTGRFYSETIGHYCEANGWAVHWVENKALHEYRSMMKSPSKSDAMDARLLAHYLTHQHQTTTRPDETSRILRHLTQELRGLHKQRLQYRNRLLQLLKVTFPELKIGTSARLLELLESYPSAEKLAQLEPAAIQAILKNRKTTATTLEAAQASVGFDNSHYCDRIQQAIRIIRALDSRITAAGQEATDRVKAHPDGEIVLSLPGIGPLGAAALIGTYGTIDRFKSKAEFKHKLGVAANDRQSGTSVNSRTMNRRATKYGRTALHMAALACLGPATGNHYFKAYFAAHRNDEARGHNKRLLGRLRGKLAEVLFTLLKKRATYQKEEHTNYEETTLQPMQGL